MANSRFLNLVLVLVTIAYLTSTFAEANRGFGWNWGWGSNHSSGSNPHSGSGSGSRPSWGWGWGSGSNQNGSNWGWGWGSGSNQNGSNWGWGFGGGHKNGHNITNCAPRKIIVGGDKEWTYGVNYADWAAKAAPFYVNDILVFKYNPPAPFTHSVYLLEDKLSYDNCDLKKGKMVATPKQGAGEGFEFVIREMCPYYFACGEHEGLHCNNGTMKFIVNPVFRKL